MVFKFIMDITYSYRAIRFMYYLLLEIVDKLLSVNIFILMMENFVYYYRYI